MSEHSDQQGDQNEQQEDTYRFRVDKALFETAQRQPTGAAILQLAGLDSNDVILVQATKGGARTEIGPTQTVDLAEPGLERFFTMKNEHTNGLDPAQREFALLAEDEACLESTGLEWEARQLQQERWLFLRGYRLPDGLEPRVSDLGIRLSANYPMTEIDMAYFNPPLRRVDHREIPYLATVPVGTATWQQWSRHRPAGNWRPDVDRLDSHLAFIAHVLARAAAP